MQQTFRQFDLGDVTLRPGEFRRRFDLNRGYVMSLETRHLLQNFYIEAGLWAPRDDPGDIHWGWESPTCQVRGHFLGHWLSAAARIYAGTGDAEVKGKADHYRGRTRPLPGRERWRVGRLHPHDLPRLGGPREARLGAALHAPQDADGAVRHGGLRRQRSGASHPRALGRVVLPVDGPVLAGRDGRHPRRGDRRDVGGVGQPLRHHRQRQTPRADGALRPPAALRAAAGGRGRADQHARQHHHPRGPGGRAGLGGHRRAALARYRRGLLGLGGDPAGGVLHRRDRPTARSGPRRSPLQRAWARRPRSTAPSTT